MHPGTREARLAAALLEASDTLSEGFDATRYLERVSDHCVEILGARGAGIMLVDGGAKTSLAVSSRHQRIAHDLLTVQRRGGPCLDSYGTGRPVPPVAIGAAHAADRWPDFTERALRHDIASTFAVPLRRRETLLGALNVFAPALPGPGAPSSHDGTDGSDASDGSDGTGWSDWSVRVAQVLADAAAVGLQNQRVHTQYRVLADQSQTALGSRVRVEQAKGMLAERWGTGVDQAFATMRRYARRHRLSMDEVASRVLDRTTDRDEPNA